MAPPVERCGLGIWLYSLSICLSCVSAISSAFRMWAVYLWQRWHRTVSSSRLCSSTVCQPRLPAGEVLPRVPGRYVVDNQWRFLLWAMWATVQGAIYLGAHESPQKSRPGCTPLLSLVTLWPPIFFIFYFCREGGLSVRPGPGQPLQITKKTHNVLKVPCCPHFQALIFKAGIQ